jgi:hypothetical protein
MKSSSQQNLNIKISNIALMLNTCDAYSDLWELFFDQLKLNFGIIKNMHIYINSETKNYDDPELKITNVNYDLDNKWSNRLKKCIASIKEEFIISIPEECILESKVDMFDFNKAIDLLIIDQDIACVQLVKIPGNKLGERFGPYIQRKYDYRNLISQQASIWRTSKYVNYVIENTTPWEFEVLSSARGLLGDDKFYCISDDSSEVFNYNYGLLVTRGYWVKEEIDRLVRNYGFTFNLDARPVLYFDEINKKINKFSWFYWNLRYKKYIILISKIFKRDINYDSSN